MQQSVTIIIHPTVMYSTYITLHSKVGKIQVWNTMYRYMYMYIAILISNCGNLFMFMNHGHYTAS